MQHAHVQELVSFLLFLSFFSLGLDVHVYLRLLFGREVGALVGPVISLSTIVAVGISGSVHSLVPRPGSLIP